jgi:hypothetical protein
MIIHSILNHLNQLPHRGATTREERKAAEFLSSELQQAGLQTTSEVFKAVPTYSWEVISISLVILGGLVLSPWYAYLGTALTLLGVWNFYRHFNGQKTLFTRLLPKRTSQNVIGRLNTQDGPSHRVVLLMAHYDSARASAVFAPKAVANFRFNFLLNFTLSVLAIPWAYLGSYWGSYPGYQIICGLLAMGQLANIAIHIHRELFHRFVPGLNDNASGVAVIFQILENLRGDHLADTDLWVLFTGCEETGIQGARAFLDSHKAELSPENTIIINIDNVGAGQLRYVTGEGMLTFWHYQGTPIEICAGLNRLPEFKSVKPLEYRLAYFDALNFTQQGYACTTLIALDENQQIPNWHWYTDQLVNIDPDNLEFTAKYGTALIRQFNRYSKNQPTDSPAI